MQFLLHKIFVILTGGVRFLQYFYFKLAVLPVLLLSNTEANINKLDMIFFDDSKQIMSLFEKYNS